MEVVLDNAGGVVAAGEVAGQYRGVGKRKWGKWVSEIREPGKKTRIWLGSFESPEMAAVAHDVAAFRLRGREARLNFPGLIHHFRRPATAEPEDVRAAALEAAAQVRLRPDLVMQPGGCPDPPLGDVARDVLLGADKLAAVAHDVAALRLRGREARLNFPGLIHHFRRPATAEPEDVRAAALEAAAQVRLRPDLVMQPGGYPDPRLGDVSRDVVLAADELAAESPNMWAELAEAMLIAPPVLEGYAADNDEWTQGTIWDPSIWNY